jgi:hypothetical protein
MDSTIFQSFHFAKNNLALAVQASACCRFTRKLKLEFQQALHFAPPPVLICVCKANQKIHF